MRQEHTVPEQPEREHELSEHCWCKPTVERWADDGTQIVQHGGPQLPPAVSKSAPEAQSS